MQAGKIGPGRPTLGSWVVYGLGSECNNLPGYVVLDDPPRLCRQWRGELAIRLLATCVSRNTISIDRFTRTQPATEHQVTSAVADIKQDLRRQLDELHRREHPISLFSMLVSPVTNWQPDANLGQ